MMYLAVGMPGPFEFFIILVIVVILFGVGKLPKVMGQLGKGLKAFKDGAKKGESEDLFDVTPDETKSLSESNDDDFSAVDEAQEVSSDESRSEKAE
ncbi:MAG: Sec-independent protein translocase subunit TatA/TatB [Myxococcota bacterium]